MTTASSVLVGVLCLAWAMLYPKTAAADEVDCADWDGVVDRNIEFKDGCTFYGTVKIKEGNVTLDCDDGVIDGGPRSDAPNGRRYGIEFAAPTGKYSVDGIQCNEAAPLRTNITIRNCTIRNQRKIEDRGGIGISLRRRFRELPKLNEPEKCTDHYPDTKYLTIHDAYRLKGLDAASAAQTRPSGDDAVTEAIRALSVGHITIEHVTIEDLPKPGLYIWEYSHDYEVTDLEVRNTSIGIYIDQASHNNTIEASVFEDNTDTGIKIDSAEENTVRGSFFAGHRGTEWPAAGIELFKNCGERAAPRMKHSSFNLFTENEFVDNDIGIWVGARQGLPRRDNAPFDCMLEEEKPALDIEAAAPRWVDLDWDAVTLDAEQCVGPQMLSADLINQARDDYELREGTREKISWFRDYAYANDIIDNTFYGNTQAGVVIWDDDSSVLNNSFGGLQGIDVCVGNQFREVIGDPVNGVIVEGNVSLSHGSSVYLPVAAVHRAELSQSANVDASMTAFMVLDQ